jgi:hypothetical protein
MTRRGVVFVCISLSLLIAPLAPAQEPLPPFPSQEAVAACAGRESGASCLLQQRDRSMSGTCRQVSGGSVACVPEAPHLGTPLEALEACEGRQEGAACGIEGPRGEPLAGICRSGSSGESLACVPLRRPALPTGRGGS